MSTQTTPFQQTKFRYQTGKEAGKAITAVDLSKASLTIATSGFVKGDMIEIEGLGDLNGLYPVASVAADKVTLSSEVDWSGKDVPTNFSQAKAAKIIFSDQFCAIKNIEKSDDTLSTEDVTTVCSEGTETEPGEIEYGSIKLGFFYAPSSEHQAALRKKFYAKETFAYKLEFPKNQGTAYGVGFLENAGSFSGEVKGKYEGSVSIKPAKRDYLLPA